MADPLSQAEIDYKASQFHKEFRQLVHKYAGNTYELADARLLVAMNRVSGVLNSFVWTK